MTPKSYYLITYALPFKEQPVDQTPEGAVVTKEDQPEVQHCQLLKIAVCIFDANDVDEDYIKYYAESATRDFWFEYITDKTHRDMVEDMPIVAIEQIDYIQSDCPDDAQQHRKQ